STAGSGVQVPRAAPLFSLFSAEFAYPRVDINRQRGTTDGRATNQQYSHRARHQGVPGLYTRRLGRKDNRPASRGNSTTQIPAFVVTPPISFVAWLGMLS